MRHMLHFALQASAFTTVNWRSGQDGGEDAATAEWARESGVKTIQGTLYDIEDLVHHIQDECDWGFTEGEDDTVNSINDVIDGIVQEVNAHLDDKLNITRTKLTAIENVLAEIIDIKKKTIDAFAEHVVAPQYYGTDRVKESGFSNANANANSQSSFLEVSSKTETPVSPLNTSFPEASRSEIGAPVSPLNTSFLDEDRSEIFKRLRTADDDDDEMPVSALNTSFLEVGSQTEAPVSLLHSVDKGEDAMHDHGPKSTHNEETGKSGSKADEEYIHEPNGQVTITDMSTARWNGKHINMLSSNSNYANFKYPSTERFADMWSEYHDKIQGHVLELSHNISRIGFTNASEYKTIHTLDYDHINQTFDRPNAANTMSGNREISIRDQFDEITVRLHDIAKDVKKVLKASQTGEQIMNDVVIGAMDDY